MSLYVCFWSFLIDECVRAGVALFLSPPDFGALDDLVEISIIFF